MPTTDIIGYLWSSKQALDLDGVPDCIQMAADLQRSGVECVRLMESKILGVTVSSTTHFVRRPDTEWADLVAEAIRLAAARDLTRHVWGDSE